MTGRALEIVRPGIQTIVVDRGRFGHRSIGVAWCGAMDGRALSRALAMAGERADVAALEIAYGAFECRFTHATRAALSGADCEARLDGVALAPEGAFDAQAGATLSLQAPRRGSRTILAVKGGFDVPLRLGSRTTDLGAGFGGFLGRALRRGDVVPIAPEGAYVATPRAAHEEPFQTGGALEARVLRTDEHGAFAAESREAFWQAQWEVTHESNRIGYRLSGPALRFEREGSIRPHAVFPGVVQVPPGGAPIVLMSDAQTTGGYPKIGVVVEEDLARLAQLQAGGRLRFVEAR